MDMSLRHLKQTVKAGTQERIDRQHAAQKSTAREWIDILFDAGSFVETDTLRKDSHVVAGFGTVNMRPVCCFAQDYTSAGGAMTVSQSRKIEKILDTAALNGTPVVMMLDSAGVKVDEGVLGIRAYADIFKKLARISGVCPMVALVLGECRGSAVIMTQLSDFVIQGPKGRIALHGLQVMNTAKDDVFGPETMAAQGVCSVAADSDEAAIRKAIEILDYLPSCSAEDALVNDGEDLNRLLTADGSDASALIADLADGGVYLETGKGFGNALKTALTRIGGRSVGIIACDRNADGGRLDESSCLKAARFARLCDCYHLPIITLVDSEGAAVPGILGQGGLIKALAGLSFTLAEATSPKMCVITGKAVGASYAVLGAHGDYTLAWENALISPMTGEVGAAVLYDGDLSEGADRAELEKKYTAEMSAVNAAELALIDEAVESRDTRKYLIAALEMYVSKRDANLPRKHADQP